jgi:hypothetical protein
MSDESQASDPRDANQDGETTLGERFAFARKVWRSTPVTVRRGVVAVCGSTLLVLGAALVVLPGPFTLPLVIAGLAVLSTEFAWAERLLVKSREKAREAANVVRRRRS